MTDRTEQSGYHVSFTKWGPFWFWVGWHENDDEWSRPWGRGISLSKQSAIWTARRLMVSRIVQAHTDEAKRLSVNGDELVRLADADKLPHAQEQVGGER